MGLAGIITLLLLGILLILLEIFVVPGITIAGIGGLVLLILGIYFSYSSYGAPTGHFILLGTFFAVGLILFVSYKSGAVKAMTLTAQVSSKVKPDINEKVKIGDTGKCISRLAPMGTVLINNELLEASSKGGFIDQNTEIVVVHVIDNKIIVEPKN